MDQSSLPFPVSEAHQLAQHEADHGQEAGRLFPRLDTRLIRKVFPFTAFFFLTRHDAGKDIDRFKLTFGIVGCRHWQWSRACSPLANRAIRKDASCGRAKHITRDRHGDIEQECTPLDRHGGAAGEGQFP
jgi:hypothetical protein